MIAFAEEHAVGAQAGPDKAGVLDQDTVQAVELIECQSIFAGLEDRTTPALKSAARRTLAFDRKAGTAICQQQKARGPGDQLSADPAYGFCSLVGEAAFSIVFESLGAANDWAIAARAKQVIPDAVALR